MDFAWSDLAAECVVHEGNGVRVRRADAENCEITHVRIDSEEAAMRIGKPRGRYVTVGCGEICKLDAEGEECAARVLSVEIRDLALRMCGKRTVHNLSLLALGLGNMEMTPDALGPKTVKLLPVTRHFQEGETQRSVASNVCELAAISPGVTAQTGIEAAELLQCMTAKLHPDLVIVIDALAARSPERLGTTVQLCDSGIQPGAGIGSARLALTEKSVGAPVMALGVPTVINCATLLADVAGSEAREQKGGLERMRPFFVCPKEIDLLVGRAAMLLARAIEKAFFE